MLNLSHTQQLDIESNCYPFNPGVSQRQPVSFMIQKGLEALISRPKLYFLHYTNFRMELFIKLDLIQFTQIQISKFISLYLFFIFSPRGRQILQKFYHFFYFSCPTCTVRENVPSCFHASKTNFLLRNCSFLEVFFFLKKTYLFIYLNFYAALPQDQAQGSTQQIVQYKLKYIKIKIF